MSVANFHFCLAVEAVAASHAHRKGAPLQVHVGQGILVDVRVIVRLFACLWQTSRQLVGQAIVSTGFHPGIALETATAAGFDVQPILAEQMLCDGVVLHFVGAGTSVLKEIFRILR